MKFACSLPLCLIALGCSGAPDLVATNVPLHLDQEQRLADQPLTASTESVNRYHSVLSRFDAVDLTLSGKTGALEVGFREHGSPSTKLSYQNIDARFLLPLLDYPHEKKLDAFDRVNLMLAEYSRNGVDLAHQQQNREYGYFTSHDLFNDDEEYTFSDGKVLPNPGARPKRMSLVNNCLTPGLWELSGADSVGELYHAWLTLPDHIYFAMLRRVNGIDASDDELRQALGYQKQLPDIAIALDRLREVVQQLGSFPVEINREKKIGGYSTQDSRRKVQRKFFQVQRAGATIQPATLADLQPGDVFQFFSFIPPGIYTNHELRTVVYEPIWTTVELNEVNAKTAYPGTATKAKAPLGALELTLRNADGTRAIVVGNVPIDLLVEAEDFDIPGFGVGVFRASEPIERRYLFVKEGPRPVYAYSALVKDHRMLVANNHEQGLEQIYLRPFRRGNDEWLRITLVAYERIIDLVELEVKLPDGLAQKIKRASAQYQRPLWRSFSDSNLL